MNSAVAMIEEDAVPQAPKRSRVRKVLVIAAPILLLATGGGLWFSGALSRHGNATVKSRAVSSEMPTLVDVPDIVTNLDSGSHKPVFVKLKARIEVAHVADQATIAANMPRILDAFQTYLRSTRPEELHGGEGTYRLREALMNRIDTIAAPVQVLDILFVEMLIQ